MNTRKKKVGMISLAAMALIVSVANVPAQANQGGEPLYKTKCATCHGADGKGETATGKALKVKDFASEDVQKMSDADLSGAISAGKGKMPAYKTLTPDQIKDLVAYVRELGKKK
jgi:cytochrome c6